MGYDVNRHRSPALAYLAVQADPAAQAAIHAGTALTLPDSTRACADATTTVLRIGPTEWLVIASLADESVLADALRESTAGEHAAIVILSDAYARFELSGPDVFEVLAQMVAVDLRGAEVGTAIRCGCGKASAVVHKRSADAFDMHVDATLAKYFDELLRVCAGS